MKRTRVLFVGEHPLGCTGNSGMLNTMVNSLDREKFHPFVFAVDVGTDPLQFVGKPPDYPIILATEVNDLWGTGKLLELILRFEYDIIFMVGIDIWRYTDIFGEIQRVKDQNGTKFVALFPYDLQFVRKDWLKWIEYVDFPCVYSKYGYDLLKPYVKNIRFFRPDLRAGDLWGRFDLEVRKKLRGQLFGMIPEDKLIFGFVGVNQVRKDPQKLIRGFALAKKEVPDIHLYMHTSLSKGQYNLKQYALDCNLRSGDLTSRPEGVVFKQEEMVKLYNTFDCLVNCSMQEGLSWTPIEAMACGCPVIASDTTAQTEIVEGAGVLVPCNDSGYIPMKTKNGISHVDARACRADDIAEAIKHVASSVQLREKMARASIVRSKEWRSEVSDVNALLSDVTKVRKEEIDTGKITDAILFAQHSSAGDVLMSTQCFKGLKERHLEKKLVYMTQPKFQGIVEGNPYIDDIIDWNPRLAGAYEVVYNPHQEKILPGGWNNLDVKLYTMYPYFCNVKPEPMFIDCIKPEGDFKLLGEEIFDLETEDYIVLNSGGQSEYRRYKHFDLVLKGFNIPIFQIGGEDDPRCKYANDLRGKLSWRESAYVMKHATIAVVVDSYCSHLAGATDTPAVVLFGPAPARVTAPCLADDRIIKFEPDMLKVCDTLSHCWGNIPYGKQPCASPCINTISPVKVKKAVTELLSKFRKNQPEEEN